MNPDPGHPLLWGAIALGALVIFLSNALSLSALKMITSSEEAELNFKETDVIAVRLGEFLWGFIFLMSSMFSLQNLALGLIVLIVLLLTCCLFVLEAIVANRVSGENKRLLCQRFSFFIKAQSFIYAPTVKIVARFNQKATAKTETDPPFETIVETIQQQQENSELDTDDFEMINGVLSLHDKTAREVMVPRTDAFMIDITNDNDRNIDSILEMDYSRIPVYHEDKDNIVGVIHIKNMLKRARQFGFDRLTIRQVMHPAFFVPESTPIDELLRQMKNTQNQMAILLDEYGGVVGLTTLEDLLEEIVGDIEDESDEPDKLIEQVEENEFIVQGKMTLTEFNDEFGTKLEMSDVDTIAGYIIAKTGKIPDDGEELTITEDDGLRLKTVEIVDDTRITKVLATIPAQLAGWRKMRALAREEEQE